ncbi:hypothetical protein [Pandoraea terrigena]|uniref:Uncharacterized protein n=1 Tax=Pandoraea terrigena TaxID=2508292 RepID=A0A5E4V5G1_9BURK|nr:hypothetical protein [Pandoraea terrigena]VVE07083.1 hypothetical protein PTE31013_02445 [Pandoraea terrigena]
MQAADAVEFARALGAAHVLVRVALPTPEITMAWFGKLSRWPLVDVVRALDKHGDISRYAPVPADIIALLPSLEAKRLAADEAWPIALASNDEAATVWLTDEILSAFDAARDLVADGDEIAGRMAFKAAYTRITEANRAAGAAPNVIRSPGTDRTTDAAADQRAIALGFITAAQVERQYPALSGPVAQNVGLLAAPSKTDSDGARAAKEQFRLMVERMRSVPTGESAFSREARERHEATERAKRDLAQRVAAYERGQQ